MGAHFSVPSKAAVATEPPQSVARTPESDHFEGALLGLALGDFLGFLVEGQDTKQCRAFAQLIVAGNSPEKTDALRLAREKGVPFGQYSDDTQMTRELLQSYANMGYFDPSDCAKRLALLAKESRILGCGLGTAKAFAKLNRGIPWDQAGSPPGSAGNGASVRAAAIGLMFSNDRLKLIEAARNQAIITHKDLRCQAGAVAVATAVAFLLKHSDFTAIDFLDEILASVEGISTDFTDALNHLKTDWILLPFPIAVEKIKIIGREFDDGTGDGISGFVTTSILAAILVFLQHRRSILECLTQCIALGGDTDSTTAVASCLCGAFVGLKRIEGDIDAVRCVNDARTWTYDEMKKLAREVNRIASEVADASNLS